MLDRDGISDDEYQAADVEYSIDCATRNAMLAARDLVAKLSVIAR